jgi:DNA topoisomerase-1
MSRSLLVVESPAKAKTLSKYLGRSFVVKATIGHIKDLPEDRIGVDVEKEFAVSLRISKGKAKVVQGIKDAAEEAQTVYLAADPDREGEAIAWHVFEEIQKVGKGKQAPTVFRILLHEITKKGVEQALALAGPLNRPKYESQLARRVLDRLVGYELSPLLWKKVSKGLSAGRVQSVSVGLVVDREREILAFVPQEYWVFRATLEGKNPPPFEARLVRIKGKKATVADEQTATPLRELLRGLPYKVVDLIREEKKRYAPPPFITSTLQQDAFRLYRFSTKKTMTLAQRLYEGVDLGEEGLHGLITYMRTDSVRISDDALAEVRDYIAGSYGKEYVPSSPNRFKNRKSAQDAHEGIRPTSMRFDPGIVAKFVDPDMLRLYRLIWNRFVASQMTPARFDVTTARILAGELHEFEASGRVPLFDGFLRVSGPMDTENGESNLPELTVGEPLTLLDLTGEQNFTQPPSRFTEGTLVKEMERLGIGRPSTYASILTTIQEKGYVGKDSSRFQPTELGFVVTDLLREGFPDILDSGFTAELEEDLDRIEEGTTTRLELLTRFYDKFRKDMDAAKESMRSVKREPEKTDVLCPACQANMVIRFGRTGAFLACSTFPACRTTLPFRRDDKGAIAAEVPEKKETGLPCPLCESEMVLREGRFGRFWACSKYPACKGTRPYSTGCPCPEEGCTGSLSEKRSKKGKMFYGCTAYPTCKFVAFNAVVARKCPECGFGGMEQVGRGKQKSLRCLKCKHTISSHEGEEA